jgi:hypothetical protein
VGINYSPKIVTDGLVLCLDAANPLSYPGSGNTWYDLSGYNNHGLIYSVDYINNSFEFSLNANPCRIDIPHSEQFNYDYNNWTYSIWSQINFNDNGSYTQFFIKGNDGGDRRPGVWFLSGATDRFHITWNSAGYGQNVYNSPTGTTLPLNKWHNFVFVANPSTNTLSLYKNGILNSSMNITDRPVNNGPIHIGGYNYRCPAMKLAQFCCYNKGLNSAEILHNYNTLKGRFGL